MLPTFTKIQNTKPSRRPIRLFDGRGLYLEVAPARIQIADGVDPSEARKQVGQVSI